MPRGLDLGFTFLEILIVMAVMGVLMGIGIGYLQNIGAASRVDQARGILRETVYACKQSSNGGTRAILDLHYRERDDALVVGAAVARPVLTHNFETLDSTSNDYPVRVEGNVEIVKGGYFGAAAKFQGGSLVFDPQSAFATTDGLSIDGWFLPVTGASTMSLVTGEGAYKLQLVRDPETQGYDVVLALDLKEPGEGRTASSQRVFRTKKAARSGRSSGWTHLQVGYDGADASILVNGIECETGRQARRGGQPTVAEEAGHRRLVVPDDGAVRLVLGGTSTPYSGLMDTLVIGGVFRSSDTERELYGLKLVRNGDKPVKVTYRNGRLDPARHAGDVLLYLEESTKNGRPAPRAQAGHVRHGRGPPRRGGSLMTRPRTRSETARGFTMLELMMAMTIFSLLGMIVVMLMRQGMTIFVQGTQDSVLQDRMDTVLPQIQRRLEVIAQPPSFAPPPPPPPEEERLAGAEWKPPPPVWDRVRSGVVAPARSAGRVAQGPALLLRGLDHGRLRRPQRRVPAPCGRRARAPT